jgi:hypothetical protein
MAVIKVPKTPRSAFRPDRPAGGLLLAQVEHLEHAVGLPFRKRKKRTEGEAAEYIRQLTARVLGQPEPIAEAKPRHKKRVKKVAKRAGAKKKAGAKQKVSKRR